MGNTPSVSSLQLCLPSDPLFDACSDVHAERCSRRRALRKDNSSSRHLQPFGFMAKVRAMSVILSQVPPVPEGEEAVANHMAGMMPAMYPPGKP